MPSMDCMGGGPRVEPKATRFGAMLVMPVDESGRPIEPPPPPQLGGILKRLTTMLALLPARLGRTGAEGSLSVATAIDEISSPTAVVQHFRGETATVPANPQRRRFYVYNDSRHRLHVKFGVGCSDQSFTLALEPREFYESKGYPVFTGLISLYSTRLNASVTEM